MKHKNNIGAECSRGATISLGEWIDENKKWMTLTELTNAAVKRFPQTIGSEIAGVLVTKARLKAIIKDRIRAGKQGQQ